MEYNNFLNVMNDISSKCKCIKIEDDGSYSKLFQFENGENDDVTFEYIFHTKLIDVYDRKIGKWIMCTDISIAHDNLDIWDNFVGVKLSANGIDVIQLEIWKQNPLGQT